MVGEAAVIYVNMLLCHGTLFGEHEIGNLLRFFSLQEAGNVPYVVENGCGKFSKSPKEIAKTVAEWFGPKADELKAMSQNALRLARPDAVFKIVRDMHELVRVRQKSFLPEYSCTA